MDNLRIYNAITAIVGVLIKKALKLLEPKLQGKLDHRIACVSFVQKFVLDEKSNSC